MHRDFPVPLLWTPLDLSLERISHFVPLAPLALGSLGDRPTRGGASRKLDRASRARRDGEDGPVPREGPGAGRRGPRPRRGSKDARDAEEAERLEAKQANPSYAHRKGDAHPLFWNAPGLRGGALRLRGLPHRPGAAGEAGGRDPYPRRRDQGRPGGKNGPHRETGPGE